MQSFLIIAGNGTVHKEDTTSIAISPGRCVSGSGARAMFWAPRAMFWAPGPCFFSVFYVFMFFLFFLLFSNETLFCLLSLVDVHATINVFFGDLYSEISERVPRISERVLRSQNAFRDSQNVFNSDPNFGRCF